MMAIFVGQRNWATAVDQLYSAYSKGFERVRLNSRTAVGILTSEGGLVDDDLGNCRIDANSPPAGGGLNRTGSKLYAEGMPNSRTAVRELIDWLHGNSFQLRSRTFGPNWSIAIDQLYISDNQSFREQATTSPIAGGMLCSGYDSAGGITQPCAYVRGPSLNRSIAIDQLYISNNKCFNDFVLVALSVVYLCWHNASYQSPFYLFCWGQVLFKSPFRIWSVLTLILDHDAGACAKACVSNLGGPE